MKFGRGAAALEFPPLVVGAFDPLEAREPPSQIEAEVELPALLFALPEFALPEFPLTLIALERGV